MHPDSPAAPTTVLLGAAGRELHVVELVPDARCGTWTKPAQGPAELGRDNTLVLAVAALAEGRMITVGDDYQVLVWDPDEPRLCAEMICSISPSWSSPLMHATQSIIAHYSGLFG